MASLSLFMSEHHRECDELLTRLDALVEASEWADADILLRNMSEEMHRHFHIEEDILFPRFERATGLPGGPTKNLRNEHAYMRALIAGLSSALAQRYRASFLDASDTLFVLVHQHNIKEEHVLYPMCDEGLRAELPDLLPHVLHQLHEGGTSANR